MTTKIKVTLSIWILLLLGYLVFTNHTYILRSSISNNVSNVEKYYDKSASLALYDSLLSIEERKLQYKAKPKFEHFDSSIGRAYKDTVYIYEKPDPTSKIIGSIPFNTKVMVIKKDTYFGDKPYRWYQIRLFDEDASKAKDSWVSGRDLLVNYDSFPSPDGKYILIRNYYVQTGEIDYCDLWMESNDGKTRIPIAIGYKEYFNSISWSYDGKWAIFDHGDTLEVISAGAKERRILTINAVSPQWAAKSYDIYFRITNTSSGGFSDEIWCIGIDGKNKRKILEIPGAAKHFYYNDGFYEEPAPIIWDSTGNYFTAFFMRSGKGSIKITADKNGVIVKREIPVSTNINKGKVDSTLATP